jgi:ribosome-binding protein aMBF1 (putative translation factor)
MSRTGARVRKGRAHAGHRPLRRDDMEKREMLTKATRATPEETKELRTEMGLWLKSLREARGMSQRDLANVLNLDYYTFISQLENGRGRIPPQRYVDWAEALGQEPRSFVKTLLSFYDPITYSILFEDSA